MINSLNFPWSFIHIVFVMRSHIFSFVINSFLGFFFSISHVSVVQLHLSTTQVPSRFTDTPGSQLKLEVKNKVVVVVVINESKKTANGNSRLTEKK